MGAQYIWVHVYGHVHEDIYVCPYVHLCPYVRRNKIPKEFLIMFTLSILGSQAGHSSDNSHRVDGALCLEAFIVR